MLHTDLHLTDGLLAKEFKIPRGQKLIQHRHKTAHLSILAAGTVILIVPGEPPRIVTGPACITVEAMKHHGVEAITDTTWYCVHGLTGDEESDEDITAPWQHEDAAAVADALGMKL